MSIKKADRLDLHLLFKEKKTEIFIIQLRLLIFCSRNTDSITDASKYLKRFISP